MTDNIEKPFIAVSLDTYNKKNTLYISSEMKNFRKFVNLGLYYLIYRDQVMQLLNTCQYFRI